MLAGYRKRPKNDESRLRAIAEEALIQVATHGITLMLLITLLLGVIFLE